MNSTKRTLFFIYQWVVAYPLLLILTVFVAISTTILSPLFPNSKLSYYPARIWARLFCKLCFVRIRVLGLEKLDATQSYIFAANHQSVFDIFVIYGWFPCYFKWLMKAELRKIPLVGKACEAAGHVFINRANPIEAKRSIEKAESQLKNGVSLVVFPEGTRTYTGKMGKFKRGAFRIATDLQLPVVPVTLRGSFERMQRNTFNVTPGIIEMIIHSPIKTSEIISDELMQQTWNVINKGLTSNV